MKNGRVTIDKEKDDLNEEQPVVRTGSRDAKITQMLFSESTAATSCYSVEINAEKLKEALWEPEINPNPESPEPWGGWMLAFALENGHHVAITNDRRGGENGLFGPLL
jgi:hypothetical protein